MILKNGKYSKNLKNKEGIFYLISLKNYTHILNFVHVLSKHHFNQKIV